LAPVSLSLSDRLAPVSIYLSPIRLAPVSLSPIRRLFRYLDPFGACFAISDRFGACFNISDPFGACFAISDPFGAWLLPARCDSVLLFSCSPPTVWSYSAELTPRLRLS
jgi:hypothetical protein